MSEISESEDRDIITAMTTHNPVEHNVTELWETRNAVLRDVVTHEKNVILRWRGRIIAVINPVADNETRADWTAEHGADQALVAAIRKGEA